MTIRPCRTSRTRFPSGFWLIAALVVACGAPARPAPNVPTGPGAVEPSDLSPELSLVYSRRRVEALRFCLATPCEWDHLVEGEGADAKTMKQSVFLDQYRRLTGRHDADDELLRLRRRDATYFGTVAGSVALMGAVTTTLSVAGATHSNACVRDATGSPRDPDVCHSQKSLPIVGGVLMGLGLAFGTWVVVDDQDCEHGDNTKCPRIGYAALSRFVETYNAALARRLSVEGDVSRVATPVKTRAARLSPLLGPSFLGVRGRFLAPNCHGWLSRGAPARDSACLRSGRRQFRNHLAPALARPPPATRSMSDRGRGLRCYPHCRSASSPRPPVCAPLVSALH